MADHAKLSPSASSRWMTCPGSVSLIESMPARAYTESVYAKAGTAMHEVAEKCLTDHKLTAADFIGKTVYGVEITAEHAAISQKFVDFVTAMDGVKFYEQRVEIMDNCFGTADAVVIKGAHLTIADLKTGQGVFVDAEENTQLLCYALGAFLKFQDVFDIETITMCIVQPPLDNYSTYTITRDDLLEFQGRLREAAMRIADEPTTYVASEKACRWCNAAPICPAMRSLADEAAALYFSDDVEVTALSEWMERLPVLKNMIKTVEARTKDLLLDGIAVPGWKVVEGRRTRMWIDEIALEEYLSGQGFNSSDYMTAPKMLSPAQMEKKLPTADVSEFVTAKVGNPTIAREDDRRDAVDRTASARRDFE